MKLSFEDELETKLKTFQMAGFPYLVSAEILWKLEFLQQSVWDIQMSAELYLKAIWMKGKGGNFSNNKDLNSALRKLGNNGHDISKIYEIEIDQADRTKLAEMGTSFYYVDVNDVRYLENGLGYGDGAFMKMKKSINNCRILLGENINKDSVDEILKRNLIRGKKKIICRKILKEILSFPNI